jgi:hypothetical protein
MDKRHTVPVLLGISLFIYLALRAFLVPISDDEYMTMHYHIDEGSSWWSILTTGAKDPNWAPNNHVLNTLFIKLEITLFGKYDWAVRLHILLSFVVCYYFMVKILLQVTESAWRLGFYLILLFLNPYLLDFFAIARGYALSIAAWSAAFYYFMEYTKSISTTHLRNTLMALFIAVWSNFSAIYFIVLFGLMFLYQFYKNWKTKDMRLHFAYLYFTYIFLALVISVPFYRTLKSGETFGGKTGFFHDSVVSYIDRFIHHSPRIGRFERFNEAWLMVEISAMVLIGIWVLSQVISLILKASSNLKTLHYYTLFQCLGIVILAEILFKVAQSPFPTARTNLLFSFPFFLCLIGAFETIALRFRWILGFFTLITTFLIWQFTLCFNFENTFEWWQNGDAKRVLSYMKNDISTTKKATKIRFGVEGWQYPSIAFYGETTYKDIMTVHWSAIVENDNFDFVYVPFEMKDKVWAGFRPVQSFKHGILFKKLE